MRKIAFVAIASMFAANVALVTPVVAATPQQERMKTCNKDAGEKALKGAERKAFMKECLSTKAAASNSAKTAQQEKMKSCNKDAADKKLAGPERKTFMSNCLKGQ